jgi:putative ATP-grasp target RiPP
MVPFGLGHAAPLPTSFTATLPGVTYDQTRQVSTISGVPAVENPAALAQWAITWGDTKDGDTVA